MLLSVLDCICPLLACLAQDGAFSKPNALRALEASRKEVVSGRIEWCVLPKGDAELALAYASRYAKNGDTIFEHHGDKDGWTIFDPGTGRGRQKYPLLYMTNADGYWEYKLTTPSCGLWKHDGSTNPFAPHVKDVLAVGVYPSSGSIESETGLNALWEGLPGVARGEIASWQEGRDGELYRVAGIMESGATITWWIDGARGWNAERVTLAGVDGTVFREARCSLKKYGDTWLPETTTYLRNGEVTEVARIRSASVNRSDDPGSFTGADLGLEPGMNIALKNEPVEIGKPPVWNGDSVSSWDAWMADVKSGRRQWGPMYQKINRGEGWDSPYMTKEARLERSMSNRQLQVSASLESHRGLWLRYVRDFIKRYQLNDEQSQKAMSILAECQKEAERLLFRMEPRLTPLLLRIEEARKKDDQTGVRELTVRFNKLRDPIDRLFETKLKPRLERLPTRAQREVAEGKRSGNSKKTDKP